jgi:hypothetical protein
MGWGILLFKNLFFLKKKKPHFYCKKLEKTMRKGKSQSKNIILPHVHCKLSSVPVKPTFCFMRYA